MNESELKAIREKISCPQFGDDHYGEWGALSMGQRRTIKRMIDYIAGQEAEIERLKTLNSKLEADVFMLSENDAIHTEEDENWFAPLKTVDEIKAEAIKECLEWVLSLFPEDKKFTTISRFTIKQKLKEMVGDE